jgi:hypothetical protein
MVIRMDEAAVVASNSHGVGGIANGDGDEKGEEMSVPEGTPWGGKLRPGHGPGLGGVRRTQLGWRAT